MTETAERLLRWFAGPWLPALTITWWLLLAVWNYRTMSILRGWLWAAAAMMFAASLFMAVISFVLAIKAA